MWTCSANPQLRPPADVRICRSSTNATGGMLARYRYREYPTPDQQQMLARTFGRARVVFNDALRTRDEAHRAGEKISDTEVQRRIVTWRRPPHPNGNGWTRLAPVALVRACQDARRAFRHWFDSLSGKRKGREGRPPEVPVPVRTTGSRPRATRQRIQRHSPRGAGGEGRERAPGMVQGARLVRGRGGTDTATGKHERCRDRPRPGSSGDPCPPAR